MRLPLLLQIAGLAGAFLVLAGYFLVRRGRITPDSNTADALNVSGSLILLGVAMYHGNLGYIVLNLTWATAGIFSAWKRHLAK